jgi:hypothetical protein
MMANALRNYIVLNWSQVRSLPAAAVAQSVEQLKRFSIPCRHHHFQIITPKSWRMPERTTSVTSGFESRPAAMRRSLSTLVATFFKTNHLKW